jgi:uncharacterized membrane protein YgaE (UPF0421/DUF939 family)
MEVATLPRLPLRAWRQVRPTVWPNLQTSVAAGLAWLLAHDVLGHRQPLFAPIAAVVAMTAGRGRHGRAAIELILGVTFGIVLADLFVRVIGSGAWQLVVVVLLTMTLAAAIGAPPFVITQAAVWAVIVVAFTHGSVALAISRFEDALVGGGVAFVIAQLLFPLRPLEVVEEAAADSLVQLERVLREIAAALRGHDEKRAARAARDDDALEYHRLIDAIEAAARATPRSRHERRRLDEFECRADELRRANREVRLLAVVAARLVRGDEPVPEPLVRGVERLADGRPDEAVAAVGGNRQSGNLASGIVAHQVVWLARRIPFSRAPADAPAAPPNPDRPAPT